MPAKDRYHDTVIQALQKSGWEIQSEQVVLILKERRLWIDLHAINEPENRAILVEVKGFENTPSPINYLASAVGKYVLYTTILDYLEINMALYLAVPLAAYNSILSEEIGQQIIQTAKIRLLVFDPSTEDIILWQT